MGDFNTMCTTHIEQQHYDYQVVINISQSQDWLGLLVEAIL